MSEFQVHDLASAPAASQPELARVRKKYGFLPNLAGVLAESPAALEGYFAIGGIFEKSSFAHTEKQIVLLTASYENQCHYCVAAHSTIAGMLKVSDHIVAALRDGMPLPDAKLEALRSFTRSLVVNRGWAEEQELEAFYEAGYTKAQALEVIVGIAMKTISNYTNHLSETPVDDAFAANAWEVPAATGA